MVRQFFLSLFFTALGTLPGVALAQREPIKMITIDVAPWASLDTKTGIQVGVFPDVVRELQRRTGYRMEMSLQPFARIDREIESGNQDCTIIVWADDRARIAEKGELLANHPMGVIARKGLPLKSYEDLQTLTISVLRGLSVSPRFDEDTSLKKEFDTDYTMGLNKIMHGRVDAIVGAVPTIRHLAKQAGIAPHLGDPLMLGSIPLVLQCSKRSPNLSLMPKLNAAIREIRQDGALAKIMLDNSFD